MILWPLFKYAFTAAVRDKLFLTILGILVCIISLSVFFGASAISERAEFAISFSAFGFRLFGVAALVLFVINYIRRSFESRDIEYLLSRPISRIGLITTYSVVFSAIAVFIALLLGLVVVFLSGNKELAPSIFWVISLMVEFIIMVNVAMFFALVMTSTTACMLIVFGFYLLSRLMGDILGIISEYGDAWWSYALGKTMELISIFIPRLDLMAQTKWLLYGMSDEISYPFVFGQAVVFVFLIIMASLVDMKRRQF
jgi:Cu-processing system permease protein